MGLSQEDKKDIKEIFVETLEPFAKAIQEDLQKVDGKVNGIAQNLAEFKIKVEDDFKYVHGHLQLIEGKIDERDRKFDARLTTVEQKVGVG